MRRLQALVLVAALVGAAAASASSGGPRPQPVLEHPNPLFTNIGLDYVNPIPARGGGAATLAPLGPGIIEASIRDLAYLRYSEQDDWGGFASPPLGSLALRTGGAVIVGGRQKLGVPHFANEAGGLVQSFTYLHGIGQPTKSSPPPSQGPLPSNSPPPCRNSGFGGTACGSGGGSRSNPVGGNGKSGRAHGHRHHHHHRHRHRVRRGGKGSCGTRGLSIVSNLPHCRIYVVNQAPGDGAVERLTIKNTSSIGYTLSLEVTGTRSPLWDDLELGVWRDGSPAPTPLPPLRFWTTQFTQLVTLAPNQVVHYTIELYLPSTAGNDMQHESAVVDFNWRAA